METVTIEIPEGKTPEWRDINGVQTLVLVDNKSKHITDRIKTFDDALCELHKRFDNGDYNAKALLDGWYNIELTTHTKDLIAFVKLRIITYALNEGWKPTYSSFNSDDDSQERWFPWFNIVQDEESLKYTLQFSDTNPVTSSVYTGDGAKLCFKSRNLAEYAGQQFTDLYADLTLDNS